MKKVLPGESIDVTVIGLEVPHAHIHLIPINSIADMGFSKPKMKFDSSELENIGSPFNIVKPLYNCSLKIMRTI